MSTLKVANIKHETSGINTLVFDNGGTSGGNGRVTTKGTIGEVSALGDKTGDITLDFQTANNFFEMDNSVSGLIVNVDNPEDIEITPEDLVEHRINGVGANIYIKGCK